MQTSDVVVLARAQAVSHGLLQDSIQLQVVHAIKGDAANVLQADFVPHADIGASGDWPAIGRGGELGVWFLKAHGNRYDVVPLASGTYTSHDGFLPLTEGSLSLPVSGTVSRQILAYVVTSYAGQQSPGVPEDSFLMTSLATADRTEALEASQSLIDSGIPGARVMGLAAQIQLGSDNALRSVATELTSLQGSAKFRHIRESIALFYTPAGPASLQELDQLIAPHAAMPNLDDALTSALQRLGGKSVLPLMANLLDSKDDTARLRAASYFALFARYADKNGSVHQGFPGPLSSESAKRNTPRGDSGVTTEQYAQFWKSWWNANRLLIDAMGAPN
jgi:hypothetical protein